MVDLIFSSGNGVALVDDAWFEHARPARVMGVDVLLAPPEEMIWSKSFVLERERYDGSDVNHLLRACAKGMDWTRLLVRFDRYWEILFSHLLLFRFAYPGARDAVPGWVVRELIRRTLAGPAEELPGDLCRGNLLSRVQYQHDLKRGLIDGRRWDEAARSLGSPVERVRKAYLAVATLLLLPMPAGARYAEGSFMARLVTH